MLEIDAKVYISLRREVIANTKSRKRMKSGEQLDTNWYYAKAIKIHTAVNTVFIAPCSNGMASEYRKAYHMQPDTVGTPGGGV